MPFLGLQPEHVVAAEAVQSTAAIEATGVRLCAF
jgi:hypothetical protein